MMDTNIFKPCCFCDKAGTLRVETDDGPRYRLCPACGGEKWINPAKMPDKLVKDAMLVRRWVVRKDAKP